MVERNAEVAPAKRIEFRMGIHLGDVVEESDGDLMGDGADEAKSEVKAALALNPNFTLRRYRDAAQSDNPVFLKGRERIIEDMRKAGVPEG